jgi:hypothetical protein
MDSCHVGMCTESVRPEISSAFVVSSIALYGCPVALLSVRMHITAGDDARTAKKPVHDLQRMFHSIFLMDENKKMFHSIFLFETFMV